MQRDPGDVGLAGDAWPKRPHLAFGRHLLLDSGSIYCQSEAMHNSPKHPRARDLGLNLPGLPGPLNAITDVPSLEVGHCTRIAGADLRTGITAILPQGPQLSCLPAGSFALNGNGEMTGLAWVEESGFLEGPVALTNTCSLGRVRDGVRAWLVERLGADGLLGGGLLPVVGETWDGRLNAIEAQALTRDDVFAALDSAAAGPVPEGSVGGGTGMVAFGFKAGIGTSSRQVEIQGQTFLVGVLVQANFGARSNLSMNGLPVGHWLKDRLLPHLFHSPNKQPQQDGSIIGVLATNAPLLPHQLKRLARRMGLGVARTGGVAYNTSGDFFLAFSTVAPTLKKGLEQWQVLPNTQLDSLLEAATYATEEAILNALCAAETMTGIHGNRVEALPREQVRAWIAQYQAPENLNSDL